MKTSLVMAASPGPHLVFLIVILLVGKSSVLAALPTEDGADTLTVSYDLSRGLVSEEGADVIILEATVLPPAQTQAPLQKLMPDTCHGQLAGREDDAVCVDLAMEELEGRIRGGTLAVVLCSLVAGGAGALVLLWTCSPAQVEPLTEDLDRTDVLSEKGQCFAELKALQVSSDRVAASLDLVKSEHIELDTEFAKLVNDFEEKLEEAAGRWGGFKTERQDADDWRESVHRVLQSCQERLAEAKAVASLLEEMENCVARCNVGDWAALAVMEEHLKKGPGQSMSLCHHLLRCLENERLAELTSLRSQQMLLSCPALSADSQPHQGLPWEDGQSRPQLLLGETEQEGSTVLSSIGEPVLIEEVSVDERVTSNRGESSEASDRWSSPLVPSVEDTGSSERVAGHLGRGELGLTELGGIEMKSRLVDCVRQSLGRGAREAVRDSGWQDCAARALWYANAQTDWQISYQIVEDKRKQRRELQKTARKLDMAKVEMKLRRQQQSDWLARMDEDLRLRREALQEAREKRERQVEARWQQEAQAYNWRVAYWQLLAFVLVRAVVYWRLVVSFFPVVPRWEKCFLPGGRACYEIHQGWDMQQTVAHYGPVVLPALTVLSTVSSRLGAKLGGLLGSALVFMASLIFLALKDVLYRDVYTRLLPLTVIGGLLWGLEKWKVQPMRGRKQDNRMWQLRRLRECLAGLCCCLLAADLPLPWE